MIQRCPQCGNWVESEHGYLNSSITAINALDAMCTTYDFIKNKGQVVADCVQNKIGGKARKLSENIIDSLAFLSSLPSAGVGCISGLFDGETYYFRCDNCKNIWIQDNNTIDETKEYYLEEKNKFIELPEENRRFLFVDHSVSTLFPNKSKIVVLQDFPKGIEFKGDDNRPIERTLYTTHPGNYNIYIPFDTYRFCLLEDEIGDLRLFLQALGAKKIEIKAVDEDKSETNRKSIFITKNKGEKLGIGKGELDASSDMEDYQFNQIVKKFIGFSKSEKTDKYPYIREDLKKKWFAIRPYWEKISQERLQGALSISQDITVNKITESWRNELSQIEMECKNIENKLGVSMKSSLFESLKSEKKFSLKIVVHFYPLSSYTNKP